MPLLFFCIWALVVAGLDLCIVTPGALLDIVFFLGDLIVKKLLAHLLLINRFSEEVSCAFVVLYDSRNAIYFVRGVIKIILISRIVYAGRGGFRTADSDTQASLSVLCNPV